MIVPQILMAIWLGFNLTAAVIGMIHSAESYRPIERRDVLALIVYTLQFLVLAWGGFWTASGSGRFA